MTPLQKDIEKRPLELREINLPRFLAAPIGTLVVEI
jgi:hypothetical protein